MYQNFGAIATNSHVEFQLFLPDNRIDPGQYIRGGDPKIKEVRIRGNFQHEIAFEREDGQCLFGYNTLVWGRIGAEYNVKLEKMGTKLEDVHQVIPATKRLRWLEIEEIEGEPEEIKARLDEACKIPRPFIPLSLWTT